MYQITVLLCVPYYYQHLQLEVKKKMKTEQSKPFNQILWASQNARSFSYKLVLNKRLLLVCEAIPPFSIKEESRQGSHWPNLWKKFDLDSPLGRH